ncbi:MAG: glycosyltransferase family 1 protein [Solirubrobacterales bacterium]|jgi:glycosyltransferase involved in cell wall biosynthesis|nr:glycosyltransferase family 1 protein [Solirubrobacterales bacterium]
MRVVFLDHVARLSGAEIGMLRLIAAADEVDAVVVLAEDGPLVAPLREAGAQVDVLPLAEGARGLSKGKVRPGASLAGAAVHMPGYVRAVARRLRELDPDLVHTMSLKAGIYGTFAARLARLPVVWHLHDRLAADYLPRPAVGLLRVLARTLPSALVAPSSSTLATVGRPFRPGVRRAVIPLPVPIPARPCEVRDRVQRVGIVGRLTPWKGQHVFLEAFARAFPDPTIHAAVIGAATFGEQAYERALRAQARALGIEDRVEFTGFVADIPGELQRLDLLVHASVLPEPLGLAVIEGMAAGVPVLAADAGGPAEYIEDGREGLLYPPGDVEALAGALGRATRDRDLRVSMSASGRRKAHAFAPEAVVGRMLALYRDVATRHRT